MKWTPNEIKKFLAQHEVFSNADSHLLDTLSFLDIQELEPGEVLLTEEENRDSYFFILLEGGLELIKKKPKDSYVLDQLDPGFVIGKAPENKEKPYFGTLRAQVLSYCLMIPPQIIEKLIRTHPLLALQLFEKVHNQSLAFFEKVNKAAFKVVNEKKRSGFLVVNLIVILSLFAIAIPYLQKRTASYDVIFTMTPLLALGALLLFIQMLATKMPFKELGLSQKNCKTALRQALFISPVAIFALVTLKMGAIRWYPEFFGHDLFSTYQERILQNEGLQISQNQFLFFAMIYPFYAFFQDILVRGALQGFFTQFFDVKYRDFLATVLASLVFAACFATYGIVFALTIFSTGLFWGWLYYKQKNILTVVFCHIIIGLTFLGFIGGFN